MENIIFKYYIFILALIQTLLGLVEMLAPTLSYSFWRKWINNKLFFVHGIFLIAAGFPLTLYKGYLSGILFYIGLFIVLTGPFVLIYPEIIKKAFSDAEKDMKPGSLVKFIYLDAFMRVFFALLLAVSFHGTFIAH